MTMQLADLLKEATRLSDYELDRKLRELIALNVKYKNLKEEVGLIEGIIKKHRSFIREYGYMSDQMIRDEYYHLYSKRIELKLTEDDLKDLKEILEYFKK